MREHRNLRCVFSLAVAGVAAYALYAAWSWPFRTALFPRVIALPILLLAALEFVLNLSGAEAMRVGHAVDFQLTDTVEPMLAKRRTIAILLWTLGFLVLILLIGFPLAVPTFFLVYLKWAGGESWTVTLSLTALAWLFMEGLFNRFLHIPFAEGLIFNLLS